MIITLASFRCADCGHAFEAPILDESRYGEFLLWSRSGRVAHLNAFEDPVYGEAKALVTEILGQADSFGVADVLQRVFGPVTCDLDPDGAPYLINGQPSCPTCHSQRIASWEMIEPEKLVELDIPDVTHKRWALQSVKERQVAIAHAIRSELKEPSSKNK